MKKIDLALWKEFNIDEIFKIDRGKRLIKLDQIPGLIAYISSTKRNNGVDNHILPPDDMTIYSKALTLSNSGSVGYCFYHPYKFVASDHCTVILIKDETVDMNSYIALFLKPIFEAMRPKYNFAREINNARLAREKILLPVDGESNPDWQFMEMYIKEKAENVIFNKKLDKLSVGKSKDLAQHPKWKEFSMHRLFKLEKGERLVVTERIPGETPLLTASSTNNGISSFIDYEYFKGKKKLFKNKITVDMFCNVFYQEFEYFSDDNIHTLVFKKKEHEIFYDNKYVNLFLVGILKMLSTKYGYGRQLRLKRFENEIIKLPVDENDEPDFRFMEDYIKGSEYSYFLSS